MCTASWWQNGTTLDFFFNRDELHTRAEELPPHRFDKIKPHYLAPLDPQGKGSWLAVNTCGLIVALLNFYDYDCGQVAPLAAPTSRGLLLLNQATCPSVQAVSSQLNSAGLPNYRPFLMLALKPREGGRLFRWNGERLAQLAIESAVGFITTSSFKPAAVRAARSMRFEQLANSATETLSYLETFHKSRNEADGALGILMNRPDARTRSISHIHISTENIVFTYHKIAQDGSVAPKLISTLQLSHDT